LPCREPLHRLRRRGGVHVPVGDRVPATRRPWPRRDADVRRNSRVWSRLRLEARGARVGLMEVGIAGVKALLVLLMVLNLSAILLWVERKGSALIQDRIGANRANI